MDCDCAGQGKKQNQFQQKGLPVNGREKDKIFNSRLSFEDLRKSGHHPPKLSYKDVVVVENKYPAFTHINICSQSTKRGPMR